VFDGFDFNILSDPNFKEDSVREELVVPILKRLGYTATGENRIIRTEPLVHPFVYIGTKAHKVNIFPDYQLTTAGKKSWVLDAKAPGEDIRSGPNVEQAYSYAIHKDVRVPVYALCNGHELVVFHVSHLEPRLAIWLQEITSRWKEVNDLLCPLAFTDPMALSYLPDWGLTLFKTGVTNDTQSHVFLLQGIQYVSKAADDLYSLVSNFELGQPYCAAFDLAPALFPRFLEVIEPRFRRQIEVAMTRQPYSIHFEGPEVPTATIEAKMGSYAVRLERETYIPMRIVRFRDRPRLTAEVASAPPPT